MSSGETRGLVQTGLISVATVPAGAAVRLDGRLLPERTPAAIRGLVPGRYAVTLEAPGRRPWAAVLAVEAEKATAAEHVILPVRKPVSEALVPGAFDAIVPVDGAPFFLAKKGGLLGDHYVCHWRSRSMRALLADGAPEARARLLRWFASEGSSCLLAHVRQEGVERYLWLRVGEDETRVEDLTNLFVESPERVYWRRGEEEALYAFRGGRIDRVLASERSVTPRFLEAVRGFGLEAGRLVVLDGSRTLKRLDKEGKEIETLVDVPRLKPEIGDKTFYDLEPVRGNAVVLRGGDGSLLADRYPYVLARSGVDGVTADVSGSLLVKEKKSAGRLDLDRPAPSVERFYRAADLRQAWWVHDASHALVRDGERLVLAEAGDFGRSVHEIARLKKNSDAFYAEETGEAFFLDRAGTLKRVQVWDKPRLLAFRSRDAAAETEP